MPEVKPEIQTFAKIIVVGVGGGGGSAVNRMIRAGIKGVEFMAVNTDLQALQKSMAARKIHIGKSTTRGLGSGMNPGVGRKAAEESQNEIREALKNADMVFITCGLGGGTGSGAGPKVAEIAKEAGALTIAVVTKPFAFEGGPRRKIADEALQDLQGKVDTLITIPNDRIWQVIDKKTTMMDAFSLVDDVLKQGVQGISELITLPGLINVDFADVKTIMQDSGAALMGMGEASGDNRAIEAAKLAISSPLLEVSIEGAKGIVFTIAGGPDITMYEVSEAAKTITENVDGDAKIIFGAVVDDNLKDTIRITVVATGFNHDLNQSKSTGFAANKKIPHYFTPTKNEASAADSDKPVATKKEELAKSLFGFKRGPINEDERSPAPEAQPGPKPELPAKPVVQKDDNAVDDDDVEIPAFIRRKMM